MDNKTFVASYVAQESERINQALKNVLGKEAPPTEAEKDALFSDMEATLAKLTSALEFLTNNLDAMDEKEEPVA